MKNTSTFKSKNNKLKDIYCGNCGKFGHTYKKCEEPVTSLGVIVYKIFNCDDSHQIKYLMIQRKDSLGYVEFLRGRFKLDDPYYIINLLKEMTYTEVENIKNFSFDNLWEKLWMLENNRQYKNEYDNSKNKFNSLKKGYNTGGEFINFDILVKKNNKYWDEPEWGFPKGRRNLKESDINCADREFQEETGFSKSDYIIIKNINPVEEVFVGSNDILYKHIYYIGKIITDKKAEVKNNNLTQITEVSNIGWFDCENALNILRPYNIEKKKVLEKVNNIILKNKLDIDKDMIYSSPTMQCIVGDDDIDDDLVVI